VKSFHCKWGVVLPLIVASKLNEDFYKMELKLEMWDTDSISDKFMGQVRYPITKLADQVRRDLWIDLDKTKDNQKVSGAIHLVMHFTYR
jgi:hypothetical protein